MTEHLFRDKTDEYDDRPKIAERTKQAERTPLPWYDASDNHGIIREGVRFATFNKQEDRDYALTACNKYEALKQSHAALMEALKDMKSGWTYIREVYGDLYGVGWDRAEILAKEALANARTEGL